MRNKSTKWRKKSKHDENYEEYSSTSSEYTIVQKESRTKRTKRFENEPRYNIDVKPMNENQRKLWDSLHDDNIIVASGCAGTGKSFLSMAYAAQQLSYDNFDKIILARPTIPSGPSIGYFPGDANEKLAVWLSQYINYLKKFLGPGCVNTWMRGENQKIFMQPLEVVRGQNWDNAIVVIEEFQNLSFEEVKMLVSRIGKNCKLIFAGDPVQRDISTSGVTKFVEIVQKHNVAKVGVVHFTSDDIVRSTIVKDIIKAFEKENV